MEVDAEMETEMETGETSSSAPAPAPAPSCSRRLGMKNTIQTTFGDDYVFQIASSPEIPTLAVSLSTNTIKLYSPETGQYYGECDGHGGTIHEISFSAPASPHVLCSCSSDGSVRAWDTRTLKQVSQLKTGSYQEIYCFCFGGSSGNLLAGGCHAQILFWDWRNLKQVACLEESHMDDVTQVRFVPNQRNKLISSSVDGLLCIFDTDGHINDDNHLESVMNVETSIAKVGFFGKMNQNLWCLTHIETLSIWDWRNARREVNYEDARTLASDKWNLDQLPWGRETLGNHLQKVDYFVDCHYSGVDDRLWVIGGTGSGMLGYFPVGYKASGGIGSPEAILEGGHAGVVRSVLPVSSSHGGLGRSKGIFGWTGGEDGRLCCWLSDESLESSRSFVSSALVVKSQRNRSHSRHHPY